MTDLFGTGGFKEKKGPFMSVKDVITPQFTRAGNFAAFTEACNRLIGGSSKRGNDGNAASKYLCEAKSAAVELILDEELSRDVQLVAGQALMVIHWIGAGVPGSRDMRVTCDDSGMAGNDKHGRSFLAAGYLPKGVTETKKEGAIGFFWRGAEKIAKLGANLNDGLMYDRARYEDSAARVIMYLMDHGFLEVREDLKAATESGRVSTMHETFFLSDILPGSFQTTSTGAGHFQENKLDLKYVTAGRGVQFNVRYAADGNTAEVIAQELKTGVWAMALPGYVDYVVNFGGLRFNDISIALMPEEAARFSPAVDLSKEGLARLKEAASKAGKVAPYAGAVIGSDATLLKAREDAPEIKWLPSIKLMDSATDLKDIYGGLSSAKISGFVKNLCNCYVVAVSQPASSPVKILPADRA